MDSDMRDAIQGWREALCAQSRRIDKVIAKLRELGEGRWFGMGLIWY